MNVDAVLSKNSRIVALAVIARDEAGIFQGASVVVLEGVFEPEMAEAMACREGLALASDLLRWKVRIATNSRNVVKNMQGFGMSS